MGGKREKAGRAAQMLLHHSAALSFSPAQHLMISDIFRNTAKVEEAEKKSRGATKRNGLTKNHAGKDGQLGRVNGGTFTRKLETCLAQTRSR